MVGNLDCYVQPAVRRRIEDLVQSLEVLREGEGSCLPRVLDELTDLLGLDVPLTYRLRPTYDGWDLEALLVRAGFTNDRFVEVFVRELNRLDRIGAYDPLRPQARQRNRVVRPRRQVSAGAWAISAAGVTEAELGLDAFDEMRVLICEGSSVLAWVGGYRTETFVARDRAVVSALVPALRTRIALEQRLHLADLSHGALTVALEAVAAAAFVVRATGDVVFANAAGQAMIAKPELAVEISDALAGAPGYRVSPISIRGVSNHYLVVMDTEANIPFERRIEAHSNTWRLTRRQRDVLRLLVRGEDNKTISAELGIALRTTEIHVSAILDKADVVNRSQLVVAFWQAS